MENNAIIALLFTLVAGAATGIGALLTFAVKKNDFKIFALGMSFSAGVMIYLSFMDILPLAIDHMKDGADGVSAKLGHLYAVLSFFGGVFFAGLIDYFVPEHVDHDMVDNPQGNAKSARARRTALLTAIALAIHNFPEGLSVFVTGLENIAIGAGVAVAITLHNIPEGVSVALPVYSATGSKRKAFAWATFSGMAEPAGALFAYFILAPYLTSSLIGTALAVTAGIMVYISLDELLPMAKEYGEEHYGIVGVFSGMAMMAVVSIIF